MVLDLAHPNDICGFADWDLDFRQLDQGAMKTRVMLRQMPGLGLMEVVISNGVHQLGCSPKGAVTIGLPFTDTVDSWEGQAVGTPGLVSFGTGRAFDGVSRSGFKALTMSVEAGLLERIADDAGVAVVDQLSREPRVPIRRNTDKLRRTIAEGRRMLRRPGATAHAAAVSDLVLAFLDAAADTPAFDDTSTASKRAHAVRRALDLIEANIDDDLSVASIAAASGASWRTLDRGFRERFGIGPKAYLNRLRLERARADLLNAGPDCKVADIANAWGFWHLGQFAADYRRMYGELPSQTRD